MNMEATILAAVMAMTGNLETGDIDGVMAAYEEGAAIVFEPGAPQTDPAIIRRIFTEMSSLNPDVTYSGHDIVVAGDIAVHIAPWSMTGKTPDGQEVKQGGLSVAVLRRQPNGDWKMVIDNPYGASLLDK